MENKEKLYSVAQASEMIELAERLKKKYEDQIKDLQRKIMSINDIVISLEIGL